MASFSSLRSCGASVPTGQSETARTLAGCGCSNAASSASTASSSACTCCKQSMRDALKLLCCNAISDLVDFDAFAFVTDVSVVGATPTTIAEDANDNLGTLSGTFRRFSPCNCDLIDISGTVYTPTATTIEVDQANLCTLNAIAFQLLPESDGETTDSTCCCVATGVCRYRQVRDLLQRELSSLGQACGQCSANCACTDDCCCAEGILSALSNVTLNKRTTLSSGLLALENVTALGTIGNVLVLGSEEQERFYFVCANKVDFLV